MNVTLPTGLTFYANNGIIGIDAEGNISEGYDGGIDCADWNEKERNALADLMIERWNRFRLTQATKRG